jgi:hypothetical protein
VRVNWKGNVITGLAMTARLTHLLNAVIDKHEADSDWAGGPHGADG